MANDMDELFGRLERNRFAPGNDPHEALAHQTQGVGSITPTGFVTDLMRDGTGTMLNDGDGIIVRDGSAAERVRLGHLGGNEYGLRITNPAGTVIIDGTSNVLKVVATGTFLAPSASAAGSFTTSVDVATGLTNKPAHIAFLEFDQTQMLPLFLWTVGTGLLNDSWEARVEPVNGDETRVTCQLNTVRTSVPAYNVRYFIFVEAAF